MTYRDPEWMQDAECKRTGPAEFFSTNFLELLEAQNVCLRECPVLEQCRAYFDAVEPPSRDRLYGVVAGEFPSERHARRRRVQERAS